MASSSVLTLVDTVVTPTWTGSGEDTALQVALLTGVLDGRREPQQVFLGHTVVT